MHDHDHDHEKALHRARIVSSVAATAISLACGTNYVYSAWAPQFADKLKLSATESNLIGLAGNLGMYSLGVPVGVFVDQKGTRPAVIIGSLLLALGYFPLRQAYEAGTGSVTLLCVFSYLSGFGGCMAFSAAVKTSAINWPHHRGTATAFPLAAFGLSAFFFSMVGSFAFPGDTGAFLLLLAIGTSALTFVGFFFLRLLPHAHLYHHAPHNSGTENLSGSQVLHRTTSQEAKTTSQKRRNADDEPGRSPVDPEQGRLLAGDHEHYADEEPDAGAEAYTQGADAQGSSSKVAATAAAAEQEQQLTSGTSASVSPPFSGYYSSTAASSSSAAAAAAGSSAADGVSSPSAPGDFAEDADQHLVDETSSLMSSSSSNSSLPGDVLVQSSVDLDRSHRIDIRGWALLRNSEFWQLFTIMAILAGIGLMTINNIGHDVNALWKHYNESVSNDFLVQRQQLHVSILSVCSFVGRLLSGVGSDFLVKKLQASRVWCLVLAAAIFVVAQIFALNVVNPHFLFFVSGLSGLAYGFLFGVFPSIVAESFGIHGLSQNWGFMTLSPVVSGNVFNLFYGAVFDKHSTLLPSGERSCSEGIDCYQAAYMVTLGACGVGLVVSLLVIRHQYLQKMKEEGKRSLED